MTEQELRQQVKDAGVRLLKTHLTQGTWGNISVRIDKDYMLVTPSGLDYERLTPEMMVKVKIDTLEWEGNIKPTSEKKIHAQIYLNHPEVGAIIHTHPTNCGVIGCAKVEVPVMSEEQQKYIGGTIRTAKYGLSSTKKLTKNTVAALEGRMGCVMANHGIMCCGKDMEDAFECCRVMEESARAYINKCVTEKMGATEFSDDLFEKYFKKVKKIK